MTVHPRRAFGAAPQLPDFVYQGRLQQNGAPANGQFNPAFALFDAPAGGSRVGATINEPVYPVTDGVFSISLAFPGAFAGTQLYLQVFVEGTPMLPRQPIATTPVAQFSLSGTTGPAGGDLSGSYPNPSIAFAAVTNSKLAAGAVINSKLADSSVSSSKIAGGYSNGAIAVTVGAIGNIRGNDCNIRVPGVQAGDIPIFVTQGGATLPAGFIAQALNAPSADTVKLRVCNTTGSSASSGNVPVYVVTLR